MQSVREFTASFLGLSVDASELTFAQMAARTLVVFVSAIAMLRLCDRRFIGKNAGFDVLMGIILGSVISRAINGSAAFFPTIGACFFLVLLHKAAGMAACHWHGFSVMLKGRDVLLVRDGQADEAALRREDITRDDLLENIRMHSNVATIAEVREARLERNGNISVIPKPEPPRSSRPGALPPGA